MHMRRLLNCVWILINGCTLRYRHAHQTLKSYDDAPGTSIAMVRGIGSNNLSGVRSLFMALVHSLTAI